MPVTEPTQNLAQKVLPKSKDLSQAIMDAGIKGQMFGKILKQLSEWYYDNTMRGHQPNKTEIEKYINSI